MLDALHAWMLAKTPPVPHARFGDAEVWLPECPPIAQPAPRPFEDAAPVSEGSAELRDLETLLHSSGADPTPFLKRRTA